MTERRRYFEDFTIGEAFDHPRGKTVSEVDGVLLTNLVMNTAQSHFNEDFMSRSSFGTRLVFGGVTAALVIGLAMEDTGGSALAELGIDRVRFLAPVHFGDTLYALSEVLTKEETPGEPTGVVVFRHYGVNQTGLTVFQGERHALFRKREFAKQ
jgi:acyl dehydratase